MRVSFNDPCPTALNVPIILKVCRRALCCRKLRTRRRASLHRLGLQTRRRLAHSHETPGMSCRRRRTPLQRTKSLFPPFTLNLLISLLVGGLLVVLRQITGTRRPRLSVLLSYRLYEIILSLLVTCQTPSLLKLHLERAGVSICRPKYLLTGGRNPSTSVLLSWSR